MNYELRFVTLYRRQGSRPNPWKEMQKNQNVKIKGTFTTKERVDKQQSEATTYRIEENITNTVSNKRLMPKMCTKVLQFSRTKPEQTPKT